LNPVTVHLEHRAYGPPRQLISTLRLNFERYLRFTWDETHHLEQSQQEHRQILEFCRNKDIEGACALLHKHIAATGQLLVQRLRARAATNSAA
jgi:DNA-binding FadR family transcriptional regulator